MDNFLGFKTEEILTFLLLIVVGYAIAKMFSGCGCSSGNGFSVGAPSQCRDTSMGFNTICRGSQQWDGGIRDFSCPTEDIPNKNIRKNWCPDFCNFNGGDALCPTDQTDPLCTGVKSLNIPGIHQDSSKNWVNQCIKGTGTAPAPVIPPHVDKNCTYTGDKDIRPPNSDTLDNYYKKTQDLERKKCQANVFQSCENAYSKHFDNKYEGYCLQTQGDTDGRGDCPLQADGTPAAWLLNKNDLKDVEYSKKACKGEVGVEGVNQGDFAWVTEKGGVGSCKKCGNSPPPPAPPAPPGPPGPAPPAPPGPPGPPAAGHGYMCNPFSKICELTPDATQSQFDCYAEHNSNCNDVDPSYIGGCFEHKIGNIDANHPFHHWDIVKRDCCENDLSKFKADGC